MHSPAAPSRSPACPPLGHLDRDTHIYPVRVYYQDTDAEGVVYHANYLHFAERARVEFMRCLGLGASVQRDHHIAAFAVRACTIDYLRPARLDDVLEVRSRIAHVGGASLRVEQIIRRAGETAASLDVRLVSIGPSGRPLRLPAAIRAALRQVSDARGKAASIDASEKD